METHHKTFAINRLRQDRSMFSCQGMLSIVSGIGGKGVRPF